MNVSNNENVKAKDVDCQNCMTLQKQISQIFIFMREQL